MTLNNANFDCQYAYDGPGSDNGDCPNCRHGGWRSTDEEAIATRPRNTTFTYSTPNTARYIQVINRGNAERWKKLKLTFTHAGGTHEYTTDEATAWASGLSCYENSNCNNHADWLNVQDIGQDLTDVTQVVINIASDGATPVAGTDITNGASGCRINLGIGEFRLSSAAVSASTSECVPATLGQTYADGTVCKTQSSIGGETSTAAQCPGPFEETSGLVPVANAAPFSNLRLASLVTAALVSVPEQTPRGRDLLLHGRRPVDGSRTTDTLPALARTRRELHPGICYYYNPVTFEFIEPYEPANDILQPAANVDACMNHVLSLDNAVYRHDVFLYVDADPCCGCTTVPCCRPHTQVNNLDCSQSQSQAEAPVAPSTRSHNQPTHTATQHVNLPANYLTDAGWPSTIGISLSAASTDTTTYGTFTEARIACSALSFSECQGIVQLTASSFSLRVSCTTEDAGNTCVDDPCPLYGGVHPLTGAACAATADTSTADTYTYMRPPVPDTSVNADGNPMWSWMYTWNGDRTPKATLQRSAEAWLQQHRGLRTTLRQYRSAPTPQSWSTGGAGSAITGHAVEQPDLLGVASGGDGICHRGAADGTWSLLQRTGQTPRQPATRRRATARTWDTILKFSRRWHNAGNSDAGCGRNAKIGRVLCATLTTTAAVAAAAVAAAARQRDAPVPDRRLWR